MRLISENSWLEMARKFQKASAKFGLIYTKPL